MTVEIVWRVARVTAPKQLSLLAAELNRELVGGVIQDVHAPTTTRVYLEIRVPGRSAGILVCTEPHVARVSAVEKRHPRHAAGSLGAVAVELKAVARC